MALNKELGQNFFCAEIKASNTGGMAFGEVFLMSAPKDENGTAESNNVRYFDNGIDISRSKNNN